MTAFQILLAFILGTVFGVFVMGMIRMARLGEDDPAGTSHGDQFSAVLDLIESEASGAEPVARRALKRLHSKVIDFGTGEAYDPDAWRHADIKRAHVQD
ncbi:hypothetical protein [Cupriavidus campinensis]|uniref:hypothetical protein n=1 Tax=Cupriavidus campinensis TaxID=151783 RepID=UPI0024E27789|nr:hypothetical protein [Cupriavidus campinensis]